MDTAIVVVLIFCALAYVISRVRRIARPGAGGCACGCSACTTAQTGSAGRKEPGGKACQGVDKAQCNVTKSVE